MYNIIYAALGSAIGGALRYWLTGAVHKYTSVLFPFGTLIVNIIGSFLLGLIIFYIDSRQIVSQEMKIFLTVGFCGGLTTFSTFSYETFTLLQQNEITHAVINILLNVFLTIIAVIAAYYFSKILSGG
jgi:fluoride exporter